MFPTGQPAVVRPGSAAFDQTFPGGSGGVFANGIKDFVSSGFVVGSDPSVNAAGTSYRYLAFLLDAGFDAGFDEGVDPGSDAGESLDGPRRYQTGCGCTVSNAAGLWWMLGILLLSVARR